jgi:hypothetical protein
MVYTFNSLCVTLNRKRSNVGENEQIELCKQCGMIKRAEEQMKKKIEELKELCEEKGHEYVNYIGSFGGHTQFVYRCGRCEEISQAFEVNMKRNLGGCAICNGINISGFKNNKADFDIVSKILSPFGHKLLKYMDCSKVVFLCFCGNPEPVTLPLTRIKTGSKCYRCLTQSRKENGMKNRNDIDEVRNSLSILGHELLDYRGRSEVVYMCSCGNPKPSIGEYRYIKAGMGCEICKVRITKKPTLVNGKIHMLMGWEPEAVKFISKNVHPILNRCIPESELLFTDDHIQIFNYVDENGKQRRYFPDMKIKGEEQFVEVKSTYTFERWAPRNLLKFKAVANSGNHLEVIIFSSPKEVEDIWSFYPDGSFRSTSGITLGELEERYNNCAIAEEDEEDDNIISVDFRIQDSGDVILSIN